MTTTLLIILGLTIVTVALGYGIYRVIQGDGYGSSGRQLPASHHRDMFDPSTRPTRLA